MENDYIMASKPTKIYANQQKYSRKSPEIVLNL